MPDRSPTEDAIEDREGLPGRYVILNHGDEDHDGVPDWADGFNLHGNEGDNAGGAFIMVVLDVSPAIDPTKHRIRFTYDASDPAGVTRRQEMVLDTPVWIYTPAPGALRIWAKDAPDSRKKECVSQGGDFIRSAHDYSLADLGIGKRRVIPLYLEGIALSATPGDQRIQVELTAEGEESVPICRDAVRVTVIGIDLDVDSDNDNGFGAPARSDREDQIEDDATKSGKYICENRDDVDNDDVPNFADGFDKWGNSGADAGGNFTPLILELAQPLDLTLVKVKFTYTASDPDGVTRTGSGTTVDPYVYSPAPGSLRIWKVDGPADRKKAEAAAPDSRGCTRRSIWSSAMPSSVLVGIRKKRCTPPAAWAIRENRAGAHSSSAAPAALACGVANVGAVSRVSITPPPIP